ncbi:MAG TPA: hypothetical protein G4O02_03900 [Caldilineae bacterium]|nr:hypothetical protein [Caldilineae bacterium]
MRLLCVILWTTCTWASDRAVAADGPHVVINEVAWGGTAASSSDEWIELYNAGDVPVDLSGWQLRAADGTPTIELRGVLAPGAFLLLERTDDDTVSDIPADIIYTGALNNRGEQLFLIDASGRVVDSANGDGGDWPAGSARPDFRSMERIDPTAPDRDDNWASNDGVHRRGLDAEGQPINGTPGGPNSASPSPSTPTVSPPVPTATPPPTPLPTARSSPTPTSVSRGRVLIHEVLYDASQPGSDAAYEWVELYNPGPEAISLAGWRLEDNTAGDTLPDVLLPAGELLVVAADEDAFREAFPDFHGTLITVADGKIGGGLANDGDRLALRDPNGVLVDALSYGDDASWLDPPAPDVPAGHSLERSPPGIDTDAAADWIDRFPPSPGQLSPPTTPTASLTPMATSTPTPSATPTATASLGSIQGYVFLDHDGDGHRQPGTEPGMGGVEIRLNTGASVQTFASGWYGFYELPAGTYTVTASRLEGYESTTPDQRVVSLAVGEVRVGVDFGRRPLPPTPTPTSTPALALTITPPPGGWPAVALNELLPRPSAVDWDQDGEATAEDEWIELYNLGMEAVDLGGWTLDDVADGGSPPYAIPEGTILPARGYLVFFRRDTGIALNNDADEVRLLTPDGLVMDAFAYERPGPDMSYSRSVDGTGPWVTDYPPSPGGPNRPPPSTNTPTATPTPTITPTPMPDVVRLNEVLPAPGEIDWDGNGAATAEDEWIELYNLGSTVIDLGGWVLDDVPDGGSTPYVIPPGTQLAPHGFIVFFRSQTGLALNNAADEVRLLAPDGSLRDRLAYSRAQSDVSFARTIDGMGGWTDQYPPSPGRPNQPPTPTPTPTPAPQIVFLNEILPAPRDYDWDGDGKATAEDEWVELINIGDVPIDLSGWMLDDVPDAGSAPYVFPEGTILGPGAFMLVFRRDSGVALNNGRDQACLLLPDGREVDCYTWDHSPGYDRSFGRWPDGYGAWEAGLTPSPGRANTPPPSTHSDDEGEDKQPPEPSPTPRPSWHPAYTPTPTPTPHPMTILSIAQVRQRSVDEQVCVRGQVTTPPDVFGRSIYVQDPSGGIQVYMSRGEWPELQEGDWVEVCGRVADFHGEREIKVRRPEDLRVLGSGRPPRPVLLRCDQFGETYEGMLVMVVGRIIGFGRRDLRLHDGRGEVRVYVRESLGWKRPRVERGQWWSAVGIVSQYAIEKPYEGGYRLLPRYEDDLAPMPEYLPSIGTTISIAE